MNIKRGVADVERIVAERPHVQQAILVLLALTLALFSIRYLLFDEPLLIINFRDISVPSDPIQLQQYYLFTWSNLGSHANLETSARVWYSLTSFLGSPPLAQRLEFTLLYSLTFLIPFASFHYLFHSYFNWPKRMAMTVALMGAFIYLMNPYMVELYSPPYTYTLSYSLLPAVMVTLLMALESPQWRYGVLFCATVTLALTPIVRYVVFILLVILLFTITYFIFCSEKMKMIRESLLKVPVWALFFFGLNLYWILPTLIVSSSVTIKPGYMVTYEMTHFFSTRYDLLDIIAMKASWWPYLPIDYPFMNGPLMFLLFIVPINALLSWTLWFRFSRKEKILMTFAGLLFVFGCNLWAGLNNPIPFMNDVYRWLLFGTPSSLGWMFRVPEYAGSVVVFSQIIMCCLFVGKLWNIFHDSTRRLWGKIEFRHIAPFIIVIIVISSTVVSSQRLTGDLDGVLKEGYYASDADYINDLDLVRPLVVLNGYSGRFLAQQLVDPFIIINGDMGKYTARLLELGDHISLSYIMSMYGSKGLITNIPVASSEIFDVEYYPPYDLYLCRFVGPSGDGLLEQLAYTSDLRADLLGSFARMGTDVCLTDSDVSQSADLLVNPNLMNYIMRSSSVEVVVPYEQTVHHDPGLMWSKALTSDPLHGEWHPYLTLMGMENWQTDLGKGLLFTWAPSTVDHSVDIPLSYSVQETTTYQIFLRCFMSEAGGNFTFDLDGTGEVKIETRAEVNLFQWVDLGERSLTAGAHKAYLTNLNGFNCLNLVIMVPVAAYDLLKSEFEQELQGKNILTVVEGEYDLKGTATEVQSGERNTSNGLALMLLPNGEARTRFDLQHSYAATCLVISKGNLTVNIGNRSFALRSDDYSITRLDDVDFALGTEMTFTPNYIRTGAGNDSSRFALDDWTMMLNGTNVPAPVGVISNGSLTIAGSGNDTAVVYGETMPISSLEASFISFDLRSGSMDRIQTFIEFLDGDGGLLNSTICRSTYDSPEMNIRALLTPPSNASSVRLKMVLNATSSDLFLSNLSIYDLNSAAAATIDYVWVIKNADQIKTTSNTMAEIAISMEDPTKYRIVVSTDADGTLVFPESYDGLWRMTSDETDGASPIQVWRLINGFQIERGDRELLIEYTPQHWFTIGVVLTTTFIVVISIVIGRVQILSALRKIRRLLKVRIP